MTNVITTIAPADHQLALRQIVTESRHRLTDQIKLFLEYKDPAGNVSTTKDSGRAYIAYTRMVYAPFGLNQKQIEARLKGANLRNALPETELMWLCQAENAAAAAFAVGMKKRWSRQDIKRYVKKRVMEVFEVFKLIRDDWSAVNV